MYLWRNKANYHLITSCPFLAGALVYKVPHTKAVTGVSVCEYPAVTQVPVTTGIKSCFGSQSKPLTLLHSERPKLCGVLAFLSATELNQLNLRHSNET